jgi:acetyl-CoA synthetase
MAERGFRSYDDFYAWSIAEPAEFWSYAVDKLSICFSRPPSKTLDLDGGPWGGVDQPDWLVDAQLNIVDSCFAGDPNARAVIERSSDGVDQVTTYGQLVSLSGRIAEGLRRSGVVPGDAIAVFLPMTTEAIAIYLGIIGAGCSVVSIADSFSAEQVASRLRIGDAKRVFTVRSISRADKTVSVYPRVVEANGPPAIVIETNRDEELRDGDVLWTDFLPQVDSPDNDADWKSIQSSPDSAINILFSSGTTGDPKAIVWDPTTAIKAAADGYFHQDIQPGDVTAWPTNLGWMMGPWLIFATLINRGTIALYTGAPSDEGFGPYVQDLQINMLGVVPSMVKAWRESGCLGASDWTKIKAFSSTGECSNPSDMRWLSEFAGGKPIIEYCGGTEIGGAYITSTLVQPNFPSMFSTPALGSGLVLLDENGETADEGEVFLIPPAMGLSRRLLNRDHHEVYFANTPTLPDVGQASSLSDGQEASPTILRRHGDQLLRAANGHYQALGRADDTMNLGGIKVGTAEIERVVSTVPGIRELAAIAVNAPGGGPSRLVIYVALQPDHSLDSTAIKDSMQQTIKQRLNPLFKIHDVVPVPQLPRTASNKIMRRHLRDDWLKSNGVR